MLTNALCLRYFAQGGRTFILDRSSTPDEHGNTKGTGHYDTLSSLIPGSRRVQVGHAGGDVICPWDVREPRARAGPQDRAAARAARAADRPRARPRRTSANAGLRRGDAHPHRHRSRVHRVPPRARERPREQLLIDALTERAGGGSLTGANADRLQSLLLRLEPYGQDGSARAHRRPGDHGPGGHAADAVRLHRPVRAAHAGADARDRRVRRAPGATTAPRARRRRARSPRDRGRASAS